MSYSGICVIHLRRRSRGTALPSRQEGWRIRSTAQSLCREHIRLRLIMVDKKRNRILRWLSIRGFTLHSRTWKRVWR